MKSAIRIPAPSAQRGVALVVVLILLLIMTLLGLASLRGAILEERMSANLYDRSLSFQAAEAALREAEAWLSTPANTQAVYNAAATASCADGLCTTPVPAVGTSDRWMDNTAATWHTALVTISGKTATPQYKIEYMGDQFINVTRPFCAADGDIEYGCYTRRFRITARSGGDDRAQVLLQSNFQIL